MVEKTARLLPSERSNLPKINIDRKENGKHIIKIETEGELSGTALNYVKDELNNYTKKENLNQLSAIILNIQPTYKAEVSKILNIGDKKFTSYWERIQPQLTIVPERNMNIMRKREALRFGFAGNIKDFYEINSLFIDAVKKIKLSTEYLLRIEERKKDLNFLTDRAKNKQDLTDPITFIQLKIAEGDAENLTGHTFMSIPQVCNAIKEFLYDNGGGWKWTKTDLEFFRKKLIKNKYILSKRGGGYMFCNPLEQKEYYEKDVEEMINKIK